MKPTLILVNPWIYDFAAYDLWSKPLGLLYLAAYFRSCGFKIHLIDCLDVNHPMMQESPSMAQPIRRAHGAGKFWREKIPKPPALKHIPRSYSRYGMSRQLFIRDLEEIEKPAAVLVTSLMTYWYPGVQEVIKITRKTHPDVPIILGGLYARLCTQHALQFSGANCVASEENLSDPKSILRVMGQFGIPVPENPLAERSLPYPAFDLMHKIDYITLLTSTGCPFRCQYCASHFLNPKFSRRDPFHILEEILYWHKDFGVQDFAFYDDALLVESRSHIGKLLEELVRLRLDLRFHTPNALHIKEITPDIARLLYLSGFRTIRLGLETSDMVMHKDLDRKVSEGEFEEAVCHLEMAGFSKKEIGVYVLMGLPGQTVDSVIETLEHVGGIGATPYLVEYSPIPRTPMWEKALSHSSYDLTSEPLFHNNTLMPCWDESQRAKVPELKRLVQAIRQNRI
jgi:radical SAM superfamily enzyme YgiQ (UPF0313 family)